MKASIKIAGKKQRLLDKEWVRYEKENERLLDEYREVNTPLLQLYQRANAPLWARYQKAQEKLLERYAKLYAKLNKPKNGGLETWQNLKQHTSK